MENKNEKALNGFLSGDSKKIKKSEQEKVIMNEREGLIERVDPIIVDKKGRQLLREQY